MASNVSVPNRKPDKIFPMQFTDITDNSNKFYLVMYWEKEGIALTEYGRLVGDIFDVISLAIKGKRANGAGSLKVQSVTPAEWAKIYAKQVVDRTSPNGTKARKYGAPYSLIPLATEDDIKVVASALPSGKKAAALPATTTKALATKTTDLHPAVRKFMQFIGVAADNSIRRTFGNNVLALKPSHLQSARKALADFASFNNGGVWQGYNNVSAADRKGAVAALNAYYRMIPPANLGRRLRDMEADLVDALMRRIESGDEEDKLAQLEQAIILEAQKVTGAQTPRSADPMVAAYEKLGCLIAPLDPMSEEYKTIYHRLYQPGPQRNKLRAQVKQIFALTIPKERDAFLAESFGAHRVYPLFHGTALANTRHILSQGLVIKRHAANGSRFGRGNYHSSISDRSWQYCRSDGRGNNVMFVSFVKVGDPYKDTGSNRRMDLTFIKKHGKHSVLGEGEWGGKGDEWITYLESQSTLAYAILLK